MAFCWQLLTIGLSGTICRLMRLQLNRYLPSISYLELTFFPNLLLAMRVNNLWNCGGSATTTSDMADRRKGRWRSGMIGSWRLRGTATRYFGVLWLLLLQSDRRALETGSACVFDDCMYGLITHNYTPKYLVANPRRRQLPIILLHHCSFPLSAMSDVAVAPPLQFHRLCNSNP